MFAERVIQNLRSHPPRRVLVFLQSLSANPAVDRFPHETLHIIRRFVSPDSPLRVPGPLRCHAPLYYGFAIQSNTNRKIYSCIVLHNALTFNLTKEDMSRIKSGKTDRKSTRLNSSHLG